MENGLFMCHMHVRNIPANCVLQFQYFVEQSATRSFVIIVVLTICFDKIVLTFTDCFGFFRDKLLSKSDNNELLSTSDTRSKLTIKLP